MAVIPTLQRATSRLKSGKKKWLYHKSSPLCPCGSAPWSVTFLHHHAQEYSCLNAPWHTIDRSRKKDQKGMYSSLPWILLGATLVMMVMASGPSSLAIRSLKVLQGTKGGRGRKGRMGGSCLLRDLTQQSPGDFQNDKWYKTT